MLYSYRITLSLYQLTLLSYIFQQSWYQTLSTLFESISPPGLQVVITIVSISHFEAARAAAVVNLNRFIQVRYCQLIDCWSIWIGRHKNWIKNNLTRIDGSFQIPLMASAQTFIAWELQWDELSAMHFLEGRVGGTCTFWEGVGAPCTFERSLAVHLSTLWHSLKTKHHLELLESIQLLSWNFLILIDATVLQLKEECNDDAILC